MAAGISTVVKGLVLGKGLIFSLRLLGYPPPEAGSECMASSGWGREQLEPGGHLYGTMKMHYLIHAKRERL